MTTTMTRPFQPARLSEVVIKSRSPLGVSPSPERAAQYDRAKDELNKLAVERWDDPAFHREQAAVLAEQIDYQIQFENLFDQYFAVQEVGEFEDVYVKESYGLKVFWTHRGGYIEESQPDQDGFEMPRETLGFHVSEFEDKIRANYAETLESLASMGSDSMVTEMNRRMLSLLQEAIPAGSQNYVDASATGLTPAVLNAALRAVADAPRPAGVARMGTTILGRAAAVDQISDFTGFGWEALEEIRQQGSLGVYRGARIARLENWTDETGASLIADNEVMVFSGNVGRFVRYGGTRVKSWAENSADYLHYRARRDAGGAIWRPQYARIIKVA